MFNKQKIIIVFILVMLLFLTGCLDFERVSYFIDLDNKTGEVNYMGIISDAKNKNEIELDFQDLIEGFYFGKGVENEILKTVKVLSKEFYVMDNKLNAKIKFSFEYAISTLNECGIIINNNGNYCIKLQHNNNYIKGNEESIQVDSIQKTIKWNKSTKIIKFEVSSGHHLKDKINNNLLPYWLKWKNSRLNWEEWKKNNLAGKNINRKKQGDKALGDSPSGMNLRKVELINQVSARDISMCYSISPDNNWLIFFPDGLWQGNNFILFNLIKYKQIPVKWEENIKDCSTINWNIFWKSNQEAFFCENNNPPSSCYKLILNDSEASVIKTLNYNDKNAKFISIIDNKCEIFSSSDSFEFQKLPRKHPELQFKETEQDLKIYYNKNLITAHKSDPPFRPYFHSVAFSPNKKFAFYCVDWEGSSFGNTQASLYLLDILKKKVTLIDEDFITDDPLFMIWTGDSKKFIYRRPGNKELFWKLILISFE